VTLFVDRFEYGFRKGRVGFVAQDIGEAVLHVRGCSPANTVLFDEDGPLWGISVVLSAERVTEDARGMPNSNSTAMIWNQQLRVD